jgi:hypothetical protein
MSRSILTPENLHVLQDESLSSVEVAAILSYDAVYVRKVRAKLNVRYARYKHYGITKRVLAQPELHDMILTKSIRELQMHFDASEQCIKKMRKAIRDTYGIAKPVVKGIVYHVTTSAEYHDMVRQSTIRQLMKQFQVSRSTAVRMRHAIRHHY